MKISEAADKFIFRTRIELDDEGNYIILREPTMQQFSQLTDDDKDNKKNIKVLGDMLASCIVESSFTQEDGATPATGEQVAKFIKDTASLEADVIAVWSNSIPFGARLQKKEN